MDAEIQQPAAKKNESDDDELVVKVKVNQLQLPFVGIFVAAGVLLIALLTTHSGTEVLKPRKWWYAISIVIVSGLVSLIGGFSVSSKKDNITYYISAFNLIWNFIGACILTDDVAGIFNISGTGNGYFAMWGLVLFSVRALANSMSVKKLTAKYLSAIRGTGLSAVILLITISRRLKEGDGRVIYIFIISVLTILIVGSLVTLETRGYPLQKRLRASILGVFAIAWIVVACVGTYKYPYTTLGNGYFACWAGSISSIFATWEAFH